MVEALLLAIPLFPFAGFLVNAAAGRRLSKRASAAVACSAMLGAFLAGAWAVWAMLRMPEGARALELTVYEWIASGSLSLPFALRLDPLGALMVGVVTGIGFLIHLYSVAYMHEESAGEYARYFSYLNLFAAFMLLLVLGANFPVMFVGWEGVGLCSYLLIGFWFQKRSAADAGKKAFIVNRIGDFGFLLGMLLLLTTFGTLDFQGLASRIAPLAPEAAFGTVSLAALLLFVGATGKSAQIPLYVWLPDAMEGPTPVSALIHAATMVTAGVYMIGRNAVLFGHAPDVLAIVAGVGLATAALSATIGLVQHDIKRVLAYSTVSQLGFMFLAMGVGAFSAGIFHLYTHAFFKALLFLGSGAVIHALAGEQDLRRMGGLRKGLPITYWTFLVGALAIAGVPGLSGFFSKDEILYRVYSSGHPVMWAVASATALLTAVYMFRLVFLTFHGERAGAAGPQASAMGHASAGHLDGGDRDAHGGHDGGRHLHDAPRPMAVALVLLAAGAVAAGYLGVPAALGGGNRLEHFLAQSFEAPQGASGEGAGHSGGAPWDSDSGVLQPRDQVAKDSETRRNENPDVHNQESERAGLELPGGAAGDHPGVALERALMGVSSGVALAGIGLAALFFLRRRDLSGLAAVRFSGLHRLLLHKCFVDELYALLVVNPIRRISETVLWRGVDAGLIDGAVNGTGQTIEGASSVLRRLQTGSLRTYAGWVTAGAIFVLGYYLWRWQA